MKKKIGSLLLLCATTALSSVAQVAGWHYQASIDSIKEAGFYNLVLTPAINAHTKTDYSDLRIVNNAGKWVPHVLGQANTIPSVEEVIMNLPVFKKESTTAFTELIVKSDGTKISNLLLQMKNTAAERFCTLTGSDDYNNWFIINDSIQIRPVKSFDNNFSAFKIQFPPSTYKLYKLYIYNKGRAPFNITAIGYAGPAIPPGILPLHEPVENPAASIIQNDSGKSSYIRITQPANYHFDEIHLKISGVKYFYRAVDLYIPSSASHSFNNPGQLLQSFIISNNSTLQFRVPKSNAAAFYLIIHNEDNLPVKLDKVSTYSSYGVATLYLEKDNKYKLIIDNPIASTPNYDLQQLNIKNRQTLPTATIGGITAIAPPAVAASKGNNKWLIWLSIAGAALVLSFFTYKLVTDMNKTKP